MTGPSGALTDRGLPSGAGEEIAERSAAPTAPLPGRPWDRPARRRRWADRPAGRQVVRPVVCPVRGQPHPRGQRPARVGICGSRGRRGCTAARSGCRGRCPGRGTHRGPSRRAGRCPGRRRRPGSWSTWSSRSLLLGRRRGRPRPCGSWWWSSTSRPCRWWSWSCRPWRWWRRRSQSSLAGRASEPAAVLAGRRRGRPVAAVVGGRRLALVAADRWRRPRPGVVLGRRGRRADPCRWSSSCFLPVVVVVPWPSLTVVDVEPCVLGRRRGRALAVLDGGRRGRPVHLPSSAGRRRPCRSSTWSPCPSSTSSRGRRSWSSCPTPGRWGRLAGAMSRPSPGAAPATA